MKAQRNPRAIATLLVAFASSSLLAEVASAQGTWNRRVDVIAATPNAIDPTDSDVSVIMHVSLDEPLSSPLDLSTEVELRVNGTTMAMNTHVISVEPGGGSCTDGAACGGGCGTGSVDGASATLLCLPDGPCAPLCDCRCTFPPIKSQFPGVPLRPKDYIEILLRPAPGALPDGEQTDDWKDLTYDEPVFWNHEILSMDLAPAAGAPPNNWDIEVSGQVLYSGMASQVGSGNTVPLGFELELEVDGVLVSTTPVPFDPLPYANACGCGNVCGSWGGLDHTCIASWGGYCHCGWPWLVVLPSIPADPGDIIEVILRPAPGALPELPGFEEDDERRDPCCPGATGVGATVGSSGRLLEQNRPNPFRLDTTIAFAAIPGAPVTLEVFDLRGRRVRTLIDGRSFDLAGKTSVTWDGRSASGNRVPAGIYFCRLETEGQSFTRKMTVAN